MFQTFRNIEIPIINDLDPEKDEHFEMEVFDATGGSRIGTINRIAVTITNDDGKGIISIKYSWGHLY